MSTLEILIICFVILMLIWIMCLIAELILLVLARLKEKRREKQWLKLKK